jgi:hypothetical protein
LVGLTVIGEELAIEDWGEEKTTGGWSWPPQKKTIEVIPSTAPRQTKWNKGFGTIFMR